MTNSVIQKFVLFVFVGIVASGCALESDPNVTAKKDIAKPILTEITEISTLSSNTKPNYTFNSTEEGSITYGGSCSSTTTSSVSGNNTITLNTLSDGTYSDCSITVTDESGNISSALLITTFTIDTTTPTISEVTVVTNPTNDSTPNYTFSSSEAGTITYGGSCSSSTTTATSGNNNITLNTLSEGDYSNCTITVTDEIGFVSSSLTITSFTVDLTAATLVEVTVVTTPTNDTTPDYTFSSSEAGTITYGGSCSSDNTSATTDNNTITLNALGDNTYSDCTITVTDNATNSVTLNISSFTIEAVSPTVSSTSPENSDSLVLKSSNIDLVFSESMDNSSITTNTSNTSCSGTLQVSSDNFSSCIQMSSSPTSSNLNKTFTIWPSSNLSVGSTYKIRITTGVKDVAGNALSSQYETSSGFTTSGLFIAVGYNGTILRSSDAITWTSQTVSSKLTLTGINYDNNTLVIVGFGYGSGLIWGEIFTSSNGITWTSRSPVACCDDWELLEGGSYGNGTFVSVGNEGTILSSSDNGTTWTSRTSGTANDLLGVGYGNGSFVAVGVNATTLTSPDGITWTSRSVDSSDTIRDVAFGNGRFVIVGGLNYGKIWYAFDVTDTWGSATSTGSATNLHYVTYGNNTFVAVGYYGNIVTSSNASNWTSRDFDTSASLQGVTYGNNIFVTVGNLGTILTSSDGTTWTSRTSGTQSTLIDVIYTE